MEIVRLGAETRPGWRDLALAVGNFDGVHRGHQALVAEALEAAARRSGQAAVLTFDPHPSAVLAPERAPACLTTLEQKAEILGSLGVHRLAVLPFGRELASAEAEDFARQVLSETLRASTVVVGASFRFGRQRRGNVPLLRELGASLGFEVVAVGDVIGDGGPVSSTRIREALARGAVEAAATLLGRLYFVDGEVVSGDGRARQLGFPTANISPLNELLPGNGVYAAWARVSGRWVCAVVNVGRRPTFGGADVRVEAHLLDFEANLYGRPVRLAFQDRLREEKRFPGPQALAAQIALDAEQAQSALRGRPAPAL